MAGTNFRARRPMSTPSYVGVDGALGVNPTSISLAAAVRSVLTPLVTLP
jgi:hypothetical protein